MKASQNSTTKTDFMHLQNSTTKNDFMNLQNSDNLGMVLSTELG